MGSDTRKASLQRILRTQHGLVTSHQAYAAGWTHQSLGRHARAGHLERPRRAVWRDPSHPTTAHQRLLLACFAVGPTAAASHWSAAWLLGADVHSGRPHLTVDENAHHRSELATVHRMAGLIDGDRRIVDGVPCLAPPVTLLTLARVTDERRLEDVLVDFLCRGLLTTAELSATLRRLARSGRDGTVALRALVDRWDDRPLPGSAQEVRLARALVQRGLPEPARQHQVRDRRGRFVARVDLAYPAWRVAIEYDSDRFHSALASRRRDVRRTQLLLAAGWRVVPASADDLRDGGASVAAALRVLATAA